MNESVLRPSINALKTQAKRLRLELNAISSPVGHSQSLEMVAHQHGYRDWNTLRGDVGNRPPACPVVIGQRTCGHYLGQYFEGEVIGVHALAHSDRFRVTFVFDDPVDVVVFESFSNFRKRVSCIIGSDGATFEKTSNGRPQLILQK